MTNDLRELCEKLRALAEEWFEMCDDIHIPLMQAADTIAGLEAQIASQLGHLLRGRTHQPASHHPHPHPGDRP